jgi:hypothetical protein
MDPDTESGDAKAVKISIEVYEWGIEIHAVEHPHVYVGVEVSGGALRATLGPLAEIISLDEGIMAGELIEAVPQPPPYDPVSEKREREEGGDGRAYH